jgi:hypothetical protein
MTTDQRLSLLEISENKRLQLLRRIRKKLRQKAVETRMWRELLQVDNLTINGNVVWQKKQSRIKHHS